MGTVTQKRWGQPGMLEPANNIKTEKQRPSRALWEVGCCANEDGFAVWLEWWRKKLKSGTPLNFYRILQLFV